MARLRDLSAAPLPMQEDHSALQTGHLDQLRASPSLTVSPVAILSAVSQRALHSEVSQVDIHLADGPVGVSPAATHLVGAVDLEVAATGNLIRS